MQTKKKLYLYRYKEKKVMNTFFKILLVADAVVAAIALVVILVKCGKSY